MTTITAKVIADSVNHHHNRLTTLELNYPRAIHAEFMTHRVFSRNASSSRAIPVSTMIKAVEADPYVPAEFGANKKGMQAGAALTPEQADLARGIWNTDLAYALEAAKALADANVHKQWANRLLEPFSHIRVIVTSTEWENFFNLRISEAAQPEIRQLAQAMLDALNGNNPIPLPSHPGIWHLPYVTKEDRRTIADEGMIMWGEGKGRVEFDHPHHYLDSLALAVSAARCARVSYRLHDGRTPALHDDLRLAGELAADMHLSPFEHQAIACNCGRFHANFRGWVSARYQKEYMQKQLAMQAMAERQELEGELREHGFDIKGLHN